MATLLGSGIGCQTTSKTPPVLPGTLAPLFGTCSIEDGAATLQLFEDGALAGSAEIEWTSRSRDHWNLEVLSAVGTTLAAASRHGLSIEIEGPISPHLPPMTVSIDEALLLDRHFSGFKAQEILCLLGGRLPYEWLSDLIAVEHQKHRTLLSFREDRRSMATEVEKLPETEPRICTTITWDTYWVFSHSLKWCLSDKKQSVGTLEGWQNLSLKWVRFE